MHTRLTAREGWYILQGFQRLQKETIAEGALGAVAHMLAINLRSTRSARC